MPSFLSVLYVALGGALGSVSRYLLGAWTLTLGKSIDFPYGTLAVNLIGCFVIGFLSQIVETRSAFTAEARAFIFIGLLGGFTTFSAFGNDTINILRDGRMFHALANVAANVIVGLALVWFGRTAAHILWK
jgi:fluoride exporter